MGLPFKDGSGPLPDSRMELFFIAVIGLTIVSGFVVFSGLDRQIEYAVTAPTDYLSLTSNTEDAVYFEGEAIQLMNQVSERSLGIDAVAAERLYCGKVVNGQVQMFRFADVISESDLTSVAGSCVGDVDIFVHSQPSGSDQLSEEDRDLESLISYTCIQYAEISVSPVNNRLNGINCWKVTGQGQGFEEIPVFKG